MKVDKANQRWEKQKEEVGVVPQTNERYLLAGSPGGGAGEVGKDQIIRGLVCQA